MKLPAEIYSSASVREIDRTAIASGQVTGYTLMNRAAQAALELSLQEFPRARHWQIVCGGGNNGGDAYVLARLAMAKGIQVEVSALVAPRALTGDAAHACSDFIAAGGAVRDWHGALDPEAQLLVDGILGSGLTRPVEGAFAEAVMALRRHEAPVVALDVPSGLSADTGEVLGCAVRADLTVTFVGLKTGLFLGVGPDLVGELAFDDLKVPAACRDGVRPDMRRMDEAIIAGSLAPRPRNAHKGEFGHLLLVGGAPGMPGAIQIAGDAALRAGAGRVSLATHPAHCTTIVASRPELMCHGMAGSSNLSALVERASVIAVGPGLGTDQWGRDLLEIVLSSHRPVVIDADALNLLALRPVRKEHWILTPHPGEAARLLKWTPGDVQADRLRALAELKARFGGVVVLKGAGTLVSADDGAPWLCQAGNPGMAAPGMGDALTGVIGSFLAQGLSSQDAAVAGVLVHASAGDAAASQWPRGMTASDLVAALRSRVNP